MTDIGSHDDEPKRDYEVGYGRPPKRTQFKPGKSGNPTGRKRKPPSVRDQARKAMARRISITEDGKVKNFAIQEIMLRNIANKAAKGDLSAAKLMSTWATAPEFAETDVVENSSLSADEQLIFNEIMEELKSSGGEDSETSDLQSSKGSDLNDQDGDSPEQATEGLDHGSDEEVRDVE